MSNGSAAVLTPTLAAGFVSNPNGDFTATYVNTTTGRSTGYVTPDQIHCIAERPLSALKHNTVVLVVGYIDDIHVINPEERPRAVMVLDSGSAASIEVDVRAGEYQRCWGNLVIGRAVRVAGTLRKDSPDKPARLFLNRVTVLGGDAR